MEEMDTVHTYSPVQYSSVLTPTSNSAYHAEKFNEPIT